MIMVDIISTPTMTLYLLIAIMEALKFRYGKTRFIWIHSVFCVIALIGILVTLLTKNSLASLISGGIALSAFGWSFYDVKFHRERARWAHVMRADQRGRQ